MARIKYSFQIEEIDIINQRSANGDTDADLVQLWLTSSADPTDKTACPPSVIGTFITSGNKFGLQFPGTSDGILPLAVSTTLGDADMVQLSASVYNFSHAGDSQRQLADAMKVSAAVLACMLAGEELFTLTNLCDKFGLTKADVDRAIGPAKAPFALVAGVLQALGDILEVFASPNCDGYAFNREVAQYLSAKFLAEKTGGRQNGSFTFEATDDTQHSPSKCGSDPKTRIVFRATVVDVEADPPPLLGQTRSPTHFKALVGQDLSRWSGTWGDADFIESSRIVCALNAPPGIKALPLELLTDKARRTPAFAQLVGRLPTERDQTVISSVALVTRPMGAAPIAPIVPIARVEITESLGHPGGDVAVNATHQAVVDVPMGTTPFLANVFAVPTLVIDPNLFRHHGLFTAVGATTAASLHSTVEEAQAASAVAGAGGLTGGGSGTNAVAAIDLSLRFADTLALDGGVCLQLYGGFDDAGFVEPRLRYIRIDSSGSLASDVMLRRTQPAPK
jgi:hypothetical protein